MCGLLRAVDARKQLEQLPAAIALRARTKRLERAHRLRFEVAAWHLRVAVDAAVEEATDIPPVLAEQRAGVVLRMALVKNEEASGWSTLDERVRAGIVGY